MGRRRQNLNQRRHFDDKAMNIKRIHNDDDQQCAHGTFLIL